MSLVRRTLRKPSVQAVCHATPHGSMSPVRVVLHDTESHDTAGISDVRGIYSFWQSQGLGYGAHLVIDRDGNTAMADCGFGTELWHVGNYNGGSIGIEQIGFASNKRAAWLHQNEQQIIKVARWIAWFHRAYGIPVEHSIEHGVCTHADVGHAGIDTSGHTDPGTGYPLDTVLWLARRYVARGGWSRAQPI